jgi:hypothetical protein
VEWQGEWQALESSDAPVEPPAAFSLCRRKRAVGIFRVSFLSKTHRNGRSARPEAQHDTGLNGVVSRLVVRCTRGVENWVLAATVQRNATNWRQRGYAVVGEPLSVVRTPSRAPVTGSYLSGG